MSTPHDEIAQAMAQALDWDAEFQEAIDWLEDCFEDIPADLTPAEVWQAIERHYDGGLAQFDRDVA